ncbi:hypothetical protein L249_5543 [Ophiocordyceps polyrhachis-furcata BCC 54312]|uniref:Autophagy-related protein 28 n=1 Tax=Ophiocordyceps polyrhachis-furcata BCC 54312 TaxID=1330021 RepID=A0A367LGB8_9HYPO|nr:hypothetical protein L249_5543 [Ophiocordyceps polyrhachis-furcata BCC 54312]
MIDARDQRIACFVSCFTDLARSQLVSFLFSKLSSSFAMGPLSPPSVARRFSHDADMSSRSLLHQNSYEIPLNPLGPRPDSAPQSAEDDFPQPRLRRPAVPNLGSVDQSRKSKDRLLFSESLSRQRQPALFAGPPPPISSSVIMSHASSPSSQNSKHGLGSHGITSQVSPISSDTVPGQSREPCPSQTSDSAWRGLWRRQRSLEEQVQQLLDLQASALMSAGAYGLEGSSGGNRDGYSEEGSITPTGTLDSASPARPRMQRSLYVPPMSTPEGNVIPVRQPARSRLTGLRRARHGIGHSLADLARVKQEEDLYVNAALSERKKVCTQLNRLTTRRTGIRNELTTLENDEDEPLGKELRELGTEHSVLNEDIQRLEKQLVGMRNRRRWLKDKMEDVRSKREAGLSGYHGALKNVDAEVNALLRRPPVLPLDQSLLSDGGQNVESDLSAGLEFLRLRPERRTVEMAQTWWEAEVGILERRMARINEEQEALEQGGATWQEAVALVTDYERGLRQLTKPSCGSPAAEETGLAQENTIRNQLPRMDQVMVKLAELMRRAESKHWNLLICAIGAELEAFKEAYAILKAIVDDDDVFSDDGVNPAYRSPPSAAKNIEEPRKSSPGDKGGRGQSEESDNEVPLDLLVSRADVERESIEDEVK